MALAQAALEGLPIDRLLVLVAAAPGHREVVESAEERLRLARLAFDFADEVALDEHPFTVDAVRDGRFGDAIFIVGADEGAAFPTWKEPEEILRHVRLAVGTRTGFPPPDLARYGNRVLSFELDSPPVSSTDVRGRIARGEPVDGLVPPDVAEAIEERRLYRGYTERVPTEDSKRH